MSTRFYYGQQDYIVQLNTMDDTIASMPNAGTVAPNFSNNITNTTSGVTTVFGADVNGGFVTTQGANNFRLNTNGLERMRVGSGGNVMIGTNTDNATDKLQVSGSIITNATGGLTATFNSTEVNGPYIAIKNSGTINGYLGAGKALLSGVLLTDLALVAVQGSLLFGAGNGAEKMRVSTAGNLLLGTVTDNTIDKLQVAGSMRSSGGLGCNGKAAQAAFTVNAAATDLATTQALVNQLRAALIAIGIAV